MFKETKLYQTLNAENLTEKQVKEEAETKLNQYGNTFQKIDRKTFSQAIFISGVLHYQNPETGETVLSLNAQLYEKERERI